MEKANDKVELRERIIKAAMMLFKQHGIKQVRMDDVASELGISKKRSIAPLPTRRPYCSRW
jgi:AcrR family transcriptional regulator